MLETYIGNSQYREYWIRDQLKERGWTEKQIKQAERCQRSEEYIAVGVLWSLLILPLPLGLLLIVYGSYLRFRYHDLSETYVRERTDLRREFDRRGLNERPGDWSVERRPWTDRLPSLDWW
jgi:hypothetical protein